jgi:DNA-binding NarL/FixJ family response regulator
MATSEATGRTFLLICEDAGDCTARYCFEVAKYWAIWTDPRKFAAAESPGPDLIAPQLVREVLDSGARAYLLKSDASRDLLTAVEALANNRSFFTAGAAQILVEGFCNPGSAAQAPLMRKSLSAREREIVQLLAEGKSSKEVAVALGISVKTAETHRANIMRKLEMHSVSELIRYAVRNNMIEP